MQTLAAPQASSYVSGFPPAAPPTPGPSPSVGAALGVIGGARAPNGNGRTDEDLPPADDGQKFDPVAGRGDAPDTPPADDGIGAGAIVGITLAVVAVVAVLAVLAGLWRSRNAKQRHQAAAPEACSVRLPGCLRNCCTVLTVPTDTGYHVYGQQNTCFLLLFSERLLTPMALLGGVNRQFLSSMHVAHHTA